MHRNTRDFDIDKLDALEQSDGSYVNGNGTITWYNELGQYHRADGPALVFADGRSHWWLNGLTFTFDDWLIKLNKSDEVKMLLRLQYA
jgi:hypothetical protein